MRGSMVFKKWIPFFKGMTLLISRNMKTKKRETHASLFCYAEYSSDYQTIPVEIFNAAPVVIG